jgi:acetyl-CoA carboxylase biotin carboxylase subunit
MNKILIANRGEIALRVMRSAKEMNIKTVAIFSEADRNAPFVRYADEAVCVGPPPSAESYLLGDKIIQICKDLNVDGIHPGYGFLSENSEFVQKATDAGITFIGPSPKSIELMGDKLKAKDTVKAYNIPMVPGTDHAISDIPAAKKIAKEVGFPILIKASAGGGGKGMRVVENEEEFEEQMDRAVSEAISSFGNGEVFIEKYVGSPKHIEIQLIADTHGNVVYLFDRECSIQRRHQKVAPSALVSDELRKQMGEAACDVARSCDYYGAGTVEFLMDENKNFYFLEMNTRLQVEHPVSEMITGIDLVKEQINVARGEKLSFTQDDLSINGHSLEVRVYAENPRNNFLPDIGKLETYRRPQGNGVRVDDGLEEGMDIPIYYDPMIAKLVTHGKDREEAIQRMTKAIDEYEITGVETTLDFCRYTINHEAFKDASFDTNFVKTHFSDTSVLDNHDPEEEKVAAIFAALELEKQIQPATSLNNETVASNWKKNRITLN